MDFIEPGKNQLLEINPELVIWTAIVFTFLVFVLWKTAWKPIIEAIDTRNNKIKKDLEYAEKMKTETKRIEEEQQAIMDKAHEESLVVIESLKREGMNFRNEEMTEAREKAEKMLNEVHEQINKAKDEAKDKLRELSLELSIDISKKILNRQVDKEKALKYIEE